MNSKLLSTDDMLPQMEFGQGQVVPSNFGKTVSVSRKP